jgi:diketogulonate reductase-like aldo/keto reductase
MGSAGAEANDYRDWMQAKGVLMQPFSSLCGPCGTTELIDGPLVTGIGSKYGKSGAQVSLKWVVQSGYPVIPKARDPKYIAENLDLFGWELSDQDMATLTAATSPPVAGPNGTSGDCPLV